MSAPVDEIDVGHDPRTRAPWHDWSARRRTVVAAALVLALAAVGGWFLARDPAPPPVTPRPVAALAPGADVVVDVPPDTSRCPSGAICRYDDTVASGAEQAFAEAFGSVGFIGRQTVTDAVTGEVYWQYVRFATGTLVTVTLTQEPVALLPTPPVPDDTPTDVDRRNGAVTLTAVRDGYLATVNAAGLPGQLLPVPAVQQWLRTVPAP